MAGKAGKLKARAPRGLADRTPADIRAVDSLVGRIREVYERYGFEPVETPLIEYTDAVGKFLPDQDRPNEGVFSFRDDDDQWLSLRYDLTAPLARYVAENLQFLPRPYRSYRFGWVFRNEKPGPGRFRQFMQFDADTVGSANPAADAEMCMMMADVMEALGIERGDYVIRVNSRKVLDGVMEAAGIVDEGQKLTVLRAIDKLDRVGADGVRQLLGEGRRDDSGDFTRGAQLSDAQITRIGRVLDFAKWFDFTRDAEGRSEQVILTSLGGFPTEHHDGVDLVSAMRQSFGDNPLSLEGVEDLSQIASVVSAAGYGHDRIKIDTSVVRGLEYYTGAVFEAELKAEIPNEKGEPVVFGSVGGGGRYDGLVGRFVNQEMPATGFSIGVSRLAAALKALGKLGNDGLAGPVVAIVPGPDDRPHAQRLVAKLREEGIASEVYVGDSGMKAQMKYADRRDAPLAIIQGSDERERGVVQIKDLALGKKIAADISDREAYVEERPGQFEVDAADIVAEVRKALDRAGRD